MIINEDRSVTLEEYEVAQMRKAATLALVAWEYRKRIRDMKDAPELLVKMGERISDEDFASMRKAAKHVKYSGIWTKYDK